MLNCLKLLCWTKTRNQGKKKIQKITQEIIYSKKQKEKKKFKEETFRLKEIKKGGKKLFDKQIRA